MAPAPGAPCYSAGVHSNDPTDPVITGQGSVLMKTNVAPGAIVTISVEMFAPKEEGTYTQYWKMYDADGKPFGIGGPAGTPWSVVIKVSKTGVVTPSTVSASVAAVGDDLTGTITTSALTAITYNWQYSNGTSYVNLVGKKTINVNGAGVPVDSYIGGVSEGCTGAGLGSGSTLNFRLNLDAYGYYNGTLVCP